MKDTAAALDRSLSLSRSLSIIDGPSIAIATAIAWGSVRYDADHPFHVTLSGATSEVAESKGPPRVRSSPFLRRRTELRGILRLARGLARSE